LQEIAHPGGRRGAERVVKALTDLPRLHPAALETLKTHLRMGLQGDGGEDTYAIQLHLQAIELEAEELLRLEASDGGQGNYEAKIIELFGEKASLKARLEQAQADARHSESQQAQLAEIFDALSKLRHHPIGYDDVVVRQMVEYVRVMSKERLLVRFRMAGKVEVGL